MSKIAVLILFLMSALFSASAELSEPLSVDKLLAVTEKELETALPHV